ncbi:MAG: alpha-amylase [Cyclobacteriaceae bacterium]|jgi:alpha-amylase
MAEPKHFEITYEIFVQSFADSNGDGIGDIPGMTSKLDYLSDLGIEAIWLMPISESPSYHKYDVVDYKSIHPDYGTLDDFKTFLHEAQVRGIKVVIDFIINHTSDQHNWFLESKKGNNNPYRDFYIWEKEDVIKDEIAKRELSLDSGNITQWHRSEGNEELYYGFFTGAMPDLNYDNPKLCKEIVEIGRFWLEDIGVDGLRMDAAKHIFRDHRAKDTHAFWVKFKGAMQAIKPDVYIVGEVWADTKTTTPFAKGLPSLFNFDLAFNIEQTINSGVVFSSSILEHSHMVSEDSTFVKTLIQNQQIFKKTNPEYVDATFLSNHDQNRIASVFDNKKNKIKQAAAILLTLPGRPFIYYGEELGMLGVKPDENIREPFLWKEKESDVSRTKWMVPSYTADSTVLNASVQRSKSNSILNTYKSLIKIRKESSALSKGNLAAIDFKNTSVLGYTRMSKDQSVLVLHNVGKQKVSVALPQTFVGCSNVLFKMRAKKTKNGGIELSANGSIILA